MAFDFSGKKVLVTGAGRGVGRGIALALARSGAKVYALARNKQRLDALAAENANIIPIVQDLSVWADTKATLEKLEALDGLVNNAGVYESAPALEQSKESIEWLLSVNLYGAINCIQVIGKKMVDEGIKGSIVNISSIGSQGAWPGELGYSVSKAALDMVTKQFALELGPRNIRVNSVNPTSVATDMMDQAPGEGEVDVEKLVMERTPLGRCATVDEVAGPVMYLLSDYAAMVTGTINMVDGGLGCNITTKQ